MEHPIYRMELDVLKPLLAAIPKHLVIKGFIEFKMCIFRLQKTVIKLWLFDVAEAVKIQFLTACSSPYLQVNINIVLIYLHIVLNPLSVFSSKKHSTRSAYF